MSRFGYALAAVVLLGGGLRADTVAGKVKAVDADKNTITVTVDANDQTFTVDKAAKVFTVKGKKGNKKQVDVPGGLSGVQVGKQVTLTTTKTGGKEVVSEIKVTKTKKKKKPEQV
jgi:hypothetical protein